MKAKYFTATLRRNRQVTVPQSNILMIGQHMQKRPAEIVGGILEFEILAIHINGTRYRISSIEENMIDRSKAKEKSDKLEHTTNN